MAAALESNLSAADRARRDRDFSRFFKAALLVMAAILALPSLLGFFGGPADSMYLGEPYNTDDHMVYASWMHQAEQGHLLMDNRFAVDSQPGLTVNLYFFAVGQVARFVGIPVASNLARVGFGLLFLYLLYCFVRRFDGGVFASKLALSLTVVGGGLGFLVWHDFGRALVLGNTLWMKPMTLGSLPTDVWQPEGFVLPSLLTNGLFAVSLCLILSVFGAILDVRRTDASWSSVVVGAVSLGLLMNIHSYDVLLVGLVSLGLLASSLGSKQVTWSWVLKVALIFAGVVPAALWFVHVLASDPVFAARAATPTYAANFRAEVFGYLPLLGLGVWGIFNRARKGPRPVRNMVGLGLFAAVFCALMLTASDADGFAVSAPWWIILFALTLVSLYFLENGDPVYNLIVAWALVGLIAPYFPGLFQRKLAMGLEIPWALLSAFALGDALLDKHRGTRNLATALTLLVLGGSGVRWMLREIELIRTDVSETTVQPVFLKPKIQGILAYLDKRSQKRCVVLCVPGGPSPVTSDDGVAVPDQYSSPALPDLNPILSGLAGVYTYAGHWSETPDYSARRGLLMRHLFSAQATDAERSQVVTDTGANYIVAPVPSAFPAQSGFADLSGLGKVVVNGPTFELIEVKAP